MLCQCTKPMLNAAGFCGYCGGADTEPEATTTDQAITADWTTKQSTPLEDLEAVHAKYQEMERERGTIMQRHAEEVARKQAELIEQLAAAFLKLTNLPADQCEIVQEQRGLQTVFYIRRREKPGSIYANAVGTIEKGQAVYLCRNSEPIVHDPAALRAEHGLPEPEPEPDDKTVVIDHNAPIVQQWGRFTVRMHNNGIGFVHCECGFVHTIQLPMDEAKLHCFSCGKKAHDTQEGTRYHP